ncbi:methylamine utilization protein [Tamlana agarivorans]|uniref:Methylamine utilization protein n=1 Tax=Pseudotamlana agarivorans TaxID=481183 RepID=A0ACC5UB18_9FLAO|nr:cytochrome c peroxidase [Tamlana agarivorans]MBU2951538.1 methylamine utilization protein [Tamlana agarivorans]
MNTYLLTVRAKAYTFGICLLLLSALGCKNDTTTPTPLAVDTQIEENYLNQLSLSIAYLDTLNASQNTADKINSYKKARKHFKLAEPILAYIDQNNYKSLNAPNILQIQEEDPTDIKIMNPFGFQVIEELLHETPIDTAIITETVNKTNSRLQLIKQNTHIDFKDYHLIWLLRNQMVRIATTGITGFDSPVLAQSLEESQFTYTTLESILKINESKFTSKKLYQELLKSIEQAKHALDADFDTFDRYAFIKNHIHQQLKLLVDTQNDWKVKFPFNLALSNNLTSLFTEETLNMDFFTDYKSDTTNLTQKVAFGKRLFNDTNLSKENNMACATCHISEKAFTDGRVTFDDRQKRNTPTLTYVSNQQLYFTDARVGSLEGQIVGVVNNHDEFNMSMDSIIARVKKDKIHKHDLDSLYQNKREDFNIRHAIASYIRTLNSFDSKFDKNINNLENTLSAEEKLGFNLFMGKAACATCHFPPMFNGTVPPNFTDTELEIIGVPETKENKALDDDLGRFDLFKTKERFGAFKTPTVRNIELTAPYMHNGVYTTLEEVVEFYNEGGGNGFGFDLEHQTLPFDNLELTEKEQVALIAFMKSLTDQSKTEFIQ